MYLSCCLSLENFQRKKQYYVDSTKEYKIGKIIQTKKTFSDSRGKAKVKKSYYPWCYDFLILWFKFPEKCILLYFKNVFYANLE